MGNWGDFNQGKAYKNDPKLELELELLDIQERSLKYWDTRHCDHSVVPPMAKSKKQVAA